MGAVAFDTLKLARTLRDSAHMSQEQAEGVSEALAEALSGAELATKGDIAAVKADIRELELKIDGRFGTLNERIERRGAEPDSRMVRYVVGTGAVAIFTIVSSVLGAAWAIIWCLPPHP